MNSNKNILLVANWDSNVGYAWWLMENFWAAIANHFSSKGHECILIYPSISKIPEIISNSPIKVIQHDYDDKSKSNTKLLKNIINDYKIGYIYFSDKLEVSFFYTKLKFWGVKKIIVHDHIPGDRVPMTGFNKLFKTLYKGLPIINADCYLAVTPFVRERMILSGCLPQKACHVVQNGIHPISENKDLEHYCHDQFGLPHDSIIIISTGRASYYKKIDFMIEAFALLSTNGVNKEIYFVYCGDGEKLEYFKNLAKEKNLTDNFIFAGQRKDVNKLLLSCDIGIQASKGEVGYSLSILEYMSAGLATLVPDRPSTCQSINDGIDGLIFDHKSPRDASIKLLSVINDAEFRKKLGRNARKSVYENYNILDTNNQLIKILSQEIS